MQLLNMLLLTPPKSPEHTLLLSHLDPLPHKDDRLFQKFHEHQELLRVAHESDSLLEQEINRFMEVGQSLSVATRAPALRRLTEMIRGRRGDVAELLSNGSDSILRLVQVLVGTDSDLVTTPTVAMEMGRCLGELGGLDLNCIALPPQPENG